MDDIALEIIKQIFCLSIGILLTYDKKKTLI